MELFTQQSFLKMIYLNTWLHSEVIEKHDILKAVSIWTTLEWH